MNTDTTTIKQLRIARLIISAVELAIILFVIRGEVKRKGLGTPVPLRESVTNR